MKPKIIIIGAGGHGKVVCDAILAEDKYELLGFVDDALPIGTHILNGYKVIESQKNIEELKGKADFFIVGIGSNKVRDRIFNLAVGLFSPGSVIHPKAILASSAAIGPGTVVLANAVINTAAIVGLNSIVNIGAIVDHDCKIGDHVHLTIGTLIGSSSIIGNYYSSAIGEKVTSFSKVNPLHQ